MLSLNCLLVFLFKTISPSIVRTNLLKEFPQSQHVYETYDHLQPEDVSSVVLFVLGTHLNVQVGMFMIVVLVQ